jgi:hypothetical protein
MKIIPAKPRYQCHNCLAFWREKDLKEIEHIFELVLPEEIMPAGECPACGCGLTRGRQTKTWDRSTTQEKFQ